MLGGQPYNGYLSHEQVECFESSLKRKSKIIWRCKLIMWWSSGCYRENWFLVEAILVGWHHIKCLASWRIDTTFKRGNTLSLQSQTLHMIWDGFSKSSIYSTSKIGLPRLPHWCANKQGYLCGNDERIGTEQGCLIGCIIIFPTMCMTWPCNIQITNYVNGWELGPERWIRYPLYCNLTFSWSWVTGTPSDKFPRASYVTYTLDLWKQIACM